MKKTTKEAGFSHIMIITVILAVGLVGALGFVFWQNFLQPKSDKGVANTTITAKSTSTANTPTSQTTSPNSTTQHYLQISQWGVKIPISGAVLNLTTVDYSNYTSNGAAAALVNVSLDSCSVGQINKYSSAVYQQGDSTRQSSDADYNAKKIGDNYYFYSYGTTSESVPSCTTQAIEEQIKTAVANIQAS